MATRIIRTHPDPVLREKAKRVPEIDASTRKLIGDMVETMKSASGVGLAAPQVGVSLRIVVFDNPDEKVTMALVNPEVVKRGGERVCEEGCLSIPGFKGQVRRCEWIKVKGFDAEGKPVRMKGKDYLAQILEHEIDHLNGVLYIDRLDSKDSFVPVGPDAEKPPNPERAEDSGDAKA